MSTQRFVGLTTDAPTREEYSPEDVQYLIARLQERLRVDKYRRNAITTDRCINFLETYLKNSDVIMDNINLFKNVKRAVKFAIRFVQQNPQTHEYLAARWDGLALHLNDGSTKNGAVFFSDLQSQLHVYENAISPSGAESRVFAQPTITQNSGGD